MLMSQTLESNRASDALDRRRRRLTAAATRPEQR